MRRAFSLIAFLVVLCGVLVGWQHRASNQGRISPPEGVSFNLLRVVQQPLLTTGHWLGDVGRVIIGRGSILQQNRQLQNRVNYLQNENTRLRRYSRENSELRQLLQLPKSDTGTPVAANIVSFDATDFSQQIGLGIGTSKNVAPKDVVYSAAGVVGQVTRVSSHYCTVLLLTDRQSGVGAITARSGARGVLQGTGGSLCKMQYFDFHSDVRAGDIVITSGDSEIFPHAMVLGTIVKVEEDKTYSRLTAYVEPAVAFDSLSAVWVRTNANQG
ncbi:MAG: rod shape-determining protein MreC [Abditibacteriaceae bacterium]